MGAANYPQHPPVQIPCQTQGTQTPPFDFQNREVDYSPARPRVPTRKTRGAWASCSPLWACQLNPGPTCPGLFSRRYTASTEHKERYRPSDRPLSSRSFSTEALYTATAYSIHCGSSPCGAPAYYTLPAGALVFCIY